MKDIIFLKLGEGFIFEVYQRLRKSAANKQNMLHVLTTAVREITFPIQHSHILMFSKSTF